MSEDTGARVAQEERLRSALHHAAEPVSPQTLARMEEAIRHRSQLGPRRGVRRWRFIAPVLAASAIAAIALVVALLAPGPTRHYTPWPASSAGKPRYVVINSYGFRPLAVYNAVSGAVTGQVTIPLLPRKPPFTRKDFQVTWMASSDDRTFVVGLYRAIPCQSRFYQFTLDSGGKPGRVTPFAPLPAIKGAGVESMAFSASGRELAVSTISGSPACAYKITSKHVGVLNLATRRLRQWSGASGNVSLTRDGTILTYDSSGFVKAIRTSSPPGPAATYSRTLVDVARYGRSDWSTFAAITPDGKRLYFNVVPETNRGPGAGQVRVAVVGSDRSRLVAAGTQYNGLMFTDPHVRHVLLYGRNRELGDLALRSGKITPFPGRLRRWIGEVFW